MLPNPPKKLIALALQHLLSLVVCMMVCSGVLQWSKMTAAIPGKGAPMWYAALHVAGENACM